MNYAMTTPCDACPFTDTLGNRRAFTTRRLNEFAQGVFPCHKTAELRENDDYDEPAVYRATETSAHCAGALIYLEKRGQPSQMMRIAERLGMYDRTKLNMEASVR